MDLPDHAPRVSQRVADLQVAVKAGQFADPRLFLVDNDAVFFSDLLHALQHGQKKIFAVADDVRVVGISAKKFAAHHDRDVVVYPVWMNDPDALRDLVPYVHALFQHLFTGQLFWSCEAVHHRVDFTVIHLHDLFIREARDVHLEGPEDVLDQLHSDLSDLWLLFPADEVVERGQDRLVPDVAIIAGEVDEEHPAFIASGHHVVVVQILLEVLSVEADAFALLARAVSVGQIFLD